MIPVLQHYFPDRGLPPSVQHVVTHLADLASDLLWTWSHAGDTFWRGLDEALWEQTLNPHLLLQNMSLTQFEALAADEMFQRRLDEVEATRSAYAQSQRWAEKLQLRQQIGTVAYFTMEVGIGRALPLYAGGLGILAGDFLKTASDLGVPIVAVSLLYQEGYFRQIIDADGNQQEIYSFNEPLGLPIRPALSPDGAWLRVTVELPGRNVSLRVWEAHVGLVTLYLLDSNIAINNPIDQGITATLYGGNREQRLTQEIVLGVGGWRALEALGIAVSICHLNEGHAAFVTIERAAAFARRNNMDFSAALWVTRAGNVFTTHTSVAAAFDRYPLALLRRYGEAYAAAVGVDATALWLLGISAAEPDLFNMALLALRTCASANGVSRLHGDISRQLFAALFPRWPLAEVPVTHITNGIHVPSWDSSWADRVWTAACGKERWRKGPDSLSETIAALSDEDIWALRGRERADLVNFARRRIARQLAVRESANANNITVAQTALGEQLLDPNVLTLGFARRFAEYKRTNLLLRDPDRLARLLCNATQPVQIVIAGKAHPEDAQGKRLLRKWTQFVTRPDVHAKAMFIEDYDITVAQEMVQGVDVWINTPRRPWEACGTSGMKVLVNGGLNVSTLDGWWAEAWTPEVGWAIHCATDECADDDAVDAREAAQLYALLETEIVPQFYARDSSGLPRTWIKRVRASMAELAPQFSSNRMMAEYVRQLYLPAAQAWRTRCANGAAMGRVLAAWHQQLSHHWHEVHWGDIAISRTAAGATLQVPLYLAEIAPEHVQVQLYADAVGKHLGSIAAMCNAGAIPGTANGYIYTVTIETVRALEDFTPRVISAFKTVAVPAEAQFIHWWSGQRLVNSSSS